MEKKDLPKGKIIQAIGPIIDVQFPEGELPAILTALEIRGLNGELLVVEVAQHIGDDIVRTVAMGSTDGV